MDDVDRLAVIGKQRALANQVLKDTGAELPALVRVVHASGRLSKAEIARRAGVTRPTLDAMLKREKETT